MAELTEETQRFFDEMLDLQDEIAETLAEIRDLLAELADRGEQHKKSSHVRHVREKR